ncbi:MAG TPA: hypothetical protein VF128_15485 [Gemmatimonadaceae bacterium]
MPVTFLVDVERRVIFLRLWGVITQEELFAAGRDANNDERAKGGFARLINLAEATELKISSEGVRRLAEVAREFSVGKRALVATSPVTFGIARMWEQNLLLPPDHSRVFDNLPDAMEFLGLDRATPWPAGA